MRDPSLAPDLNADPDSHAVHQNETLTALDLAATWNNDQTKGRVRFSGGEEHRFQDATQRDETGLSALSIETLVKDWNLSMVAGRQTLNGAQALAFVRQRHGLTNGDLDRTHRQQAVIDYVLWKLRSQGALNDLAGKPSSRTPTATPDSVATGVSSDTRVTTY